MNTMEEEIVNYKDVDKIPSIIMKAINVLGIRLTDDDISELEILWQAIKSMNEERIAQITTNIQQRKLHPSSPIFINEAGSLEMTLDGGAGTNTHISNISLISDLLRDFTRCVCKYYSEIYEIKIECTLPEVDMNLYRERKQHIELKVIKVKGIIKQGNKNENDNHTKL